MKILHTLKEVFLSSLPLGIIIFIITVFVSPLENPHDYVKLSLGYIGVVVGQAIFLVGLDVGILPIGKHIGSNLIKLKKAVFIIFFGVVFGILATVAEPALAVLARQTNMIMPVIHETGFLWILSSGIGIFVGFSLFRILKDIDIRKVFIALYVIVFVLAIFTPEEFIALAFDGSGATTGDISVPFILALGVGVSASMSKHKTIDDTFGIIGIASVGPIIALFIYGIILKQQHGGDVPAAGAYLPGTVESISEIFMSNVAGVVLALLPVLVVFIPFQFFLIKLPKKEFKTIIIGIVTVFFGLLIFITAIDYGFAFAGKYIGGVFLDPAKPEWFRWLLLLVGFILGISITLSEPAVTVLGEQLEELTSGHIKKMTIRITLAIGIGFASLICMVKILTQINILYFLIPLYAIALIMIKFTPKMFVSLAFDSGGVTGGALTSAFLTPLTLGVAQAVAAESGPEAQSILTNGFGIIAFISVTPLIAVQTLGIFYDRRVKKAHIDFTAETIAEINELLAEEDEEE